MQNLNMPNITVTQIQFYTIPIWQIDNSIICNTFKCGKKSDYNTADIRSCFLDHQQMSHHEETHIYTDGSKDRNEVECAAVCGDYSILRKLPPQSSIFTAELRAIVDALIIISNSAPNNFVIFSDSKSVLQAIDLYNNHHPIVRKINTRIVRLAARQKNIKLCWVPGHINVEGNETADVKAREAAKSNLNFLTPDIPHKDYNYLFNKN